MMKDKFRTADDYISRHIDKTKCELLVSQVTLKLGNFEAYALCNLLNEGNLKNTLLTSEQKTCLVEIGKALALAVDHPNRAFNLIKAED